jgi:hypothetical protein
MISGQDCFAVWAPDDVFWSQWAKPVVFANAAILVKEPEPTVPTLDSALLPGSFDPVAIVVDLPGPQAVLVGLALAERGFRPVPMFNGTSGPMAVVPVEPIEHALGAGAAVLERLNIGQDARPAFLIDADRGSIAGAQEPGRYDNRWVVLPQDFPSGTTLLSRGIKQVIVIRQRTLGPDQDLTHVLLRWKDAGLELSGIALETGASAERLSLAVPSGFRSLWYAAIALMGLRRSSVGGFGSTVPQQTSSGRSGFYG